MSTPKFKLHQDIWYMRNNRPSQGNIWTVSNVENAHDNWAHTKEQIDTWQHFGPTGIHYVTAHGVIKEEEAFATKEELLESL